MLTNGRKSDFPVEHPENYTPHGVVIARMLP